MYLKMNCTNVLVVVYGVILLICNNYSRNKLNAAKCTFFSVFICWRMMRGVSFSSKEETTHLPLSGSIESRAISQTYFLEFKPHLTFKLTFCRTLPLAWHNIFLQEYFPWMKYTNEATEKRLKTFLHTVGREVFHTLCIWRPTCCSQEVIQLVWCATYRILL